MNMIKKISNYFLFALILVCAICQNVFAGAPEYWGIEKHVETNVGPARPLVCLGHSDGAINPAPPPAKLELSLQKNGLYALKYEGGGYYGVGAVTIAENFKCISSESNAMLIDCASDDSESMARIEIRSTQYLSNRNGSKLVTTNTLNFSAYSPAIEALPDSQKEAILRNNTMGFDLQRSECQSQ